MKRLWIVLALSVVIAIVCIVGNNIIFDKGTQLKGKIEHAIAFAENDDMQSATDLVKQAETYFAEYEHPLGLFINKNMVDLIGESLSKLGALAKNNDRGEFLSECNYTIIAVTHILNHEKASLYNFF